jgi:hypothetical protein
VHLPTKKPIDKLVKGKSLRYQDLLDKIMANYDVIDPAPDLTREAEIHSVEALFEPESSHYSARANHVVGTVVGTEVAKRLLIH